MILQKIFLALSRGYALCTRIEIFSYIKRKLAKLKNMEFVKPWGC